MRRESATYSGPHLYERLAFGNPQLIKATKKVIGAVNSLNPSFLRLEIPLTGGITLGRRMRDYIHAGLASSLPGLNYDLRLSLNDWSRSTEERLLEGVEMAFPNENQEYMRALLRGIGWYGQAIILDPDFRVNFATLIDEVFDYNRYQPERGVSRPSAGPNLSALFNIVYNKKEIEPPVPMAA